jgi:hypothetical protein
MQLHLRAVQPEGDLLRVHRLSLADEGTSRLFFPGGSGEDLRSVIEKIYTM